jgi:carbon starvation protein
MAAIKALRNTAAGLPNAENEDPARTSRVFAPAGFVPTAAERDVMAEWDKLPAGQRLEKSGHH